MKPGVATEVEIVRWRDADTPIVRFSREFPVRLVDSDKGGQFNSPEKNTPEGKEAIKFVEDLTYNKCVLFIPNKNPVKLTDVLSFDRVLGEIFLDNRKLTTVLIENGFGSIE